jgi:transcription elongation factor Elf1
MTETTGLLLECDNCGDDAFRVYYDETASRYLLVCSICGYEHHVRAGA